MFAKSAQAPGEILAPAVKTLQPVSDVDREWFIVPARGAVRLVPDLSEPPEAREPCHFAEDDRHECEQHQA
jgi:hypothetical protein